jgi:tRNA A37 threonylcarbamoyladenosine dehydratase
MIGDKDIDYVVDAIDSVKPKAALIAWCSANEMPLVVVGGAGGQIDPTKVEIRDLARTEQEPLLKKVRKILRAQYGFSRGEKQKYHIDAVFSMEPLRYPDAGDACDVDPNSTGLGIAGLNCAGFGSSMVVTATFGMVTAGQVLRRLAEAAAAAKADEAAGEAQAVPAGQTVQAEEALLS